VPRGIRTLLECKGTAREIGLEQAKQRNATEEGEGKPVGVNGHERGEKTEIGWGEGIGERNLP